MPPGSGRAHAGASALKPPPAFVCLPAFSAQRREYTFLRVERALALDASLLAALQQQAGGAGGAAGGAQL